MNKIISIENLSKSFGKKKILDNLSLDIFEGERLGIIGVNGAGKTTLLKHIVKILEPTFGKIEYFFEEENYLNEISMQFQDSKMNLSLKTKDLIKFVSILNSDKVNKDETNKMIEVFGISEFLKNNIKKLSGGQKQRLNLLLTVMVNPKVLILDEFVTGLDILIAKKILNYINDKRKKENLTLIIVSHQPEELKDLTDRIVLLKDGKIEKEFKTKSVDTKYKGNFTDFLVKELE